MKTKKFFMTSLLVMGMIIAKAANGYPPELVLVSQPVLTYDYNSVTIYYDIQNIGDYTYRGDLCIYLDPDNGYCYASKYMRIGPGRIKRVEVSIPAYRPNPSVAYTVMPYYELNDDLYSFTTFEYFEPVRFCWYGYRNEPWVVITVGPRPRYYHRPGDYRFYYDGYHPMLPPPHHGKPLPPPDPMHHTYGYHHTCGGYPANFYPDHHVPGYNPPGDKPHDNPSGPGHNNGNPGNNGSSSSATVRPNGNNTAGSMSSSGAGNSNSNNNNGGSSGATVRPNTNSNGNSGATTRPNTNSSNNSGATTRPSSSSNSNSGTTVRPNTTSNSSGSTSRPSSNNSGTVSRPSSNSNSSGSGRSGTSSGSSRTSSSSSSSRSSSSSSSSSSRSSSSTGGRR